MYSIPYCSLSIIVWHKLFFLTITLQWNLFFWQGISWFRVGSLCLLLQCFFKIGLRFTTRYFGLKKLTQFVYVIALLIIYIVFCIFYLYIIIFKPFKHNFASVRCKKNFFVESWTFHVPLLKCTAMNRWFFPKQWQLVTRKK